MVLGRMARIREGKKKEKREKRVHGTVAVAPVVWSALRVTRAG